MNNINLHGRLPEDLPDKETVDDILLELKDTNKFDVRWVHLNGQAWRAHNKVFDNFVEKGQISIMKCDPIPTFDMPTDWWLEGAPIQTMKFKEIRYDILRHPIRITAQYKPGILSLNKSAPEILETVKETYLRLKDYIGPDIIQDQIELADFSIDFMISSCRLIK